ncbi:helix-turn-helix domain-containing protein [Pacificibacter marinus]|nr:helix-turn-helix transcriptional regulator [Pacificibacter marinus]
MHNTYPLIVDQINTTIGGLPKNSQFVNFKAMSDTNAQPQYSEIGRRLAAIRQAESQMSQKEWAEKHSFGVTQYNNWEKGVRRIAVDEAERLCNLYGLSLDFIYRGNISGVSDKIKNLL